MDIHPPPSQPSTLHPPERPLCTPPHSPPSTSAPSLLHPFRRCRQTRKPQTLITKQPISGCGSGGRSLTRLSSRSPRRSTRLIVVLRLNRSDVDRQCRCIQIYGVVVYGISANSLQPTDASSFYSYRCTSSNPASPPRAFPKS